MRIRVGLAAALAGLAGCGPDGPPTYPAGGRVVFRDGRPVAAGVVEFAPAGNGPAARGKIDPDGRFVLRTGDRPGAVAGTHQVAVVQLGGGGVAHQHKGAAGVHARYAGLDTSGLTREVRPGAENEFVIEVDAAR